MSTKAFTKIMRGLEEAQAYAAGAREGYHVTVPETVDVKSIRRGLKLTQAAFSREFGFSLDTVKHWEGGRRTPESPARAYLTVIARDPAAVRAALHPVRTDATIKRPATRPRTRLRSGTPLADSTAREVHRRIP